MEQDIEIKLIRLDKLNYASPQLRRNLNKEGNLKDILAEISKTSKKLIK